MADARRLLALGVLLLIVVSSPVVRGQDEEWRRLFQQGKTHYLLNDFPQAIRAWEAAEKLKPDVFAFPANLGKAYSALGRFRDAIAAYERAAAIGLPQLVAANLWGDVGNIRRSLRTPRRAIAAQQSALELEPTSPRHWFALAHAQEDAGWPDDALASFERCVELDADYQDARDQLEALKLQLAKEPRPFRSSVAEVNASRARSARLDLDGARLSLQAGDAADPAIRTELEELEARAAYLEALGAALAPGALVLAKEGGTPSRLRRGSRQGLEVEGESALVPWHALPSGVVTLLVAPLDKSVTKNPLGATLVLFDLGLWFLADQRVKSWIDSEPAAAPRAFEILARYRGLAEPPAGGFVWKGSEWLTAAEDDARTRDLVTVDEALVPRAEAVRLVERQRRTRRAATRDTQAARAEADRVRREHGVTEVRTILSSGDPLKRADVVVVADGFTATELPKFERLADAVSKTLLTVEPFQSYARYVNVHRVMVAAQETGVAGSRIGSSLGEGGLLTCNRELAATYGRFAPDADLVIICVNVTEARATGSPSHAGNPGVITIDASGAFNETVLHELGHAVAGLDDEYPDPALIGEYDDYDAAQEPFHFNTTRESNPKRAKWHYWLLPPALPDGEQIGCVEGAYYRQRGYYRPSRACRMHTSSAKRYCAVCLEQLELSFYSRVEPVDDVNVRTPELFLWKDDATKLSATTIAIAAASQRIGGFTARWYVDDRPAPANAVKSTGVKTELTLKALKLTEGTHEVVLRIDLRDARVRRDGGLLSSLRAWRVNVSNARQPRIVAPPRVTATRGSVVTFDVTMEGGTPDQVPAVTGPVGSVATTSADRSRRFVWCPPRSARGRYQVLHEFLIGDGAAIMKQVTEILLVDPGHNVAPVFRDQGVILATRGAELVHRLEVFDADGDGLVFSSPNLPPGAELEAMTGVLRWTPGWSTPFEGESDIVVKVSDGVAEDEVTIKLKVDNRPIEGAGAAFDVLMTTRAPSAEVRKAAFDALLASDLPRGGKLLELVRMLRDSEPEVVTRASQTLKTALEVSEVSTRGLVALELAEQTWAFVDRPEVLAFLREFLQLTLPPEARTATTRIQKDLTAAETYNRERGVQ